MARNVDEAHEMIRLVEESGIVFMNGLCHTFHGPLNQAKGLVNSGKLGELVHFYNRFAGRFEGVEKRWFADAEIAGGGVLLDTTVHSFSIFRHIAGDIEKVRAVINTRLPTKVEDTAAVALKSVSGITGEISASWLTDPGEWIVRLYCTGGVIELDYNRTPNLRYQLPKGDWVEVNYEGPDRFALEVAHFLECVRTGATPSVSVVDGARTIEAIDQAYRTARTDCA